MWIKSKVEELLPFVHVITEKSQAACALISLFPWFQIYTGSRALVLLFYIWRGHFSVDADTSSSDLTPSLSPWLWFCVCETIPVYGTAVEMKKV